MWTSKRDDHGDQARLLRAAAHGDEQARNELFRQYRLPLMKMIRLRLSRRLQGSVEELTLLKEAFQTAASRLPAYLPNPPAPFFLWLRRIALEKLHEIHDKGLGRQSGELSLHKGALPVPSSKSLAAQLLGRSTSPSQKAAKAEMRIRLQEALNTLAPLDREILALRHFEQLTLAETAQELGLDPSAASKRYVRALARLQEVFGSDANLQT